MKNNFFLQFIFISFFIVNFTNGEIFYNKFKILKKNNFKRQKLTQAMKIPIIILLANNFANSKHILTARNL